MKTWSRPTMTELPTEMTRKGGPSITVHDGYTYTVTLPNGQVVAVEEYWPQS